MWLKLFSNCVPVKGFSRSIIYDLQMQSYFYIPNSICDEFLYGENKLSKETINKLPVGYVELLKEKNVVFETNKPELFPLINFEFNSSSLITNIIVDIHDNLNHELLIHSLNCFNSFVLIMNFDIKHSIEYLSSILKLYSDTKLKMVKCYFYWNQTYNRDDLISLYNEFPFSSFVVYNAPEGIILEFKETLVIQFDDIIDYNQDVYPWLFNVNLDLFSESQKLNSYFNRKLYIGKFGEIKNAPLSDEVFGHLQEIQKIEEFEAIINKPEFQKYWFANKDLIVVCKDCENRYMCVDPRVPKINENGAFFYEKMCLYNPYICMWSGEEGYVSIDECGRYSVENEFEVDISKVEESRFR